MAARNVNGFTIIIISIIIIIIFIIIIIIETGIKPNGGFTGVHLDWVYMGRGTEELYTCWIPIGDIPVEMGTLAVLEGSSSLPQFQKLRNTYGQMDAEKINVNRIEKNRLD